MIKIEIKISDSEIPTSVVHSYNELPSPGDVETFLLNASAAFNLLYATGKPLIIHCYDTQAKIKNIILLRELWHCNRSLGQLMLKTAKDIIETSPILVITNNDAKAHLMKIPPAERTFQFLETTKIAINHTHKIIHI